MNHRNPIARVIKKIRNQVKPDDRKKVIEDSYIKESLDEILGESVMINDTSEYLKKTLESCCNNKDVKPIIILSRIFVENKKEYPHSLRCPHCHDVAFRLDHIPIQGEVIQSKSVFLPNQNRKPTKGELILCDSCGANIEMWHLKSSDVS